MSLLKCGLYTMLVENNKNLIHKINTINTSIHINLYCTIIHTTGQSHGETYSNQ